MIIYDVGLGMPSTGGDPSKARKFVDYVLLHTGCNSHQVLWSLSHELSIHLIVNLLQYIPLMHLLRLLTSADWFIWYMTYAGFFRAISSLH